VVDLGRSGLPPVLLSPSNSLPPVPTFISSHLSPSLSPSQLYRAPFLNDAQRDSLLRRARADRPASALASVDAEVCFNVELSSPLTPAEAETLGWLLRETYDAAPGSKAPGAGHRGGLAAAPHLESSAAAPVVEVGPRLSFSTAWCANALSVCRGVGLGGKVVRLEASRRYALTGATAEDVSAFAALVHDRMTEEVYTAPLSSFAVDKVPDPVSTVPVLAEGRAALEKVNKSMGLAFDDWDLDYYTNMFTADIKRDPTTVELFDIAQSNSEHSRHWFFGGELIKEDGTPYPKTLFQLVKDTYEANPNNSVVAFKDNSSTIRGFTTRALPPVKPGGPSPVDVRSIDLDLLLTAETHNFPCAVAPYPGAETGAGGRIRDTHATGRGSLMGAATAGYCVGNLQQPGAVEPWEDASFQYPASLASPLQILIDASNGASDYGNKFGEPLVAGYTRAFGARMGNGERREWLKPIMFSGAVGTMDHAHADKYDGEVGMLVVKIGGPAYRIGMGGGAASSVPSGSLDAELDFNAVQRGDAESSQKLWRAVRALAEMGDANPIVQIHDQGAGGNCNVVKEIIYPLGAKIDIRQVLLGDNTMSVLEIWGAEYQENDCILIRPESEALVRSVCERERTNMQVIGTIDGSGRVTLEDREAPEGTPARNPVDLDLDKVLGKMPRKTYRFKEWNPVNVPLELPAGTSVDAALGRVVRLVDVCSKRFLTNKVDRSVTGLVAQQQCCGPLLLPLADCAVHALSHQDTTGLATSIGEAPYKGLIDPAAQARLSFAEALTNLACVGISSLPDVRASVNWMHAAKMGQEGSAMYLAAEALSACMIALGVAVDGGKDSLSMAAVAGGETVMAPGQIVVSAYAPCPDVTVAVQPDLKGKTASGGSTVVVHADAGLGRRRLGGSSLAHAWAQIGDVSPDVDAATLKGLFETTQTLLKAGTLLAGHDVSDGGVLVAALEMAFAGNCGLALDVAAPTDPVDAAQAASAGASSAALAALFAEEVGILVETAEADAEAVVAAYAAAGVPARVVGRPRLDSDAIDVAVDGETQVSGPVHVLRAAWEERALELEALQAAGATVAQERAVVSSARKGHTWRWSFSPRYTDDAKMTAEARSKHKVAVVREEGSNGDREMAAVVRAAGMEPWDVHMSDLIHGKVTLDDFSGLVFVGGFSYADVLDSAKGWAGNVLLNPAVSSQFEAFRRRKDTFSLGVCNGCQLMALLGWVPTDSKSDGDKLPSGSQPRFVHNVSGRFESRFSQVRIEASPAVHLKGMQGSSLGVWVAHGEGQAYFPDAAVEAAVEAGALAPIRYVDESGEATERYPFNPNGAPRGIAALCSPDGRHLAMMPHPERAFLGWQLPYLGGTGVTAAGPGPWLRLFQNCRAFLDGEEIVG